ncbi:MAG: hypothetical protein ACK4P3_08340 [Fimbriimonadaceae bacterium]
MQTGDSDSNQEPSSVLLSGATRAQRLDLEEAIQSCAPNLARRLKEPEWDLILERLQEPNAKVADVPLLAVAQFATGREPDLSLALSNLYEHQLVSASPAAQVVSLGPLGAREIRLHEKPIVCVVGASAGTTDSTRFSDQAEFNSWVKGKIDGADWLNIAEARSINRSGDARVRELAYEAPLSPWRLREMLQIRQRTLTENLSGARPYRDVTYGRGGLQELRWTLHLIHLRFPTATSAVRRLDSADRIDGLLDAGMINTAERAELQEGYRHLRRVQALIDLQEWDECVFPENPDKLKALTIAAQWQDSPNRFLEYHESVVSRLSELCTELSGRLL